MTTARIRILEMIKEREKKEDNCGKGMEITKKNDYVSNLHKTH